MKIITGKQFETLIERTSQLDDLPNVDAILEDVKRDKDEALRKYTLKFDKVDIAQLKVDASEISAAYERVDRELIAHITRSVARLRRFSERQLQNFRDFEIEIEGGVFTGQRIVPIERAGVYVPGGRFPLISSVFMGVLPAKVAGVKEVIVCSPPTYDGSLHPAILVAADLSGADALYRVGGVQAVGAMAYGTESIKKVDKIVGPGNAYVTAAKKAVYGTVGIDFLAGPTEIVIIADDTADPAYVAADLIGQAEHDIDAGPILITTSPELAKRVKEEIERQLPTITTQETARQSLRANGVIVLTESLEHAVRLANARAPEHLEIQTKKDEQLRERLTNYGSLFIGPNAAEVLGDYSAGLNHVLPTNYASRYTGGLSVKDFIKIQTTLSATREGLRTVGPNACAIATAEGLQGHANSVNIRLTEKS